MLTTYSKGLGLDFLKSQNRYEEEARFSLLDSWIPRGSKGVEFSPKKEVFLVNR